MSDVVEGSTLIDYELQDDWREVESSGWLACLLDISLLC